MDLEDYLKENDMWKAEFAKKIGVSPAAIYRYIDGTRRPSLAMASLIDKETKGKVTAKDLLDWYNKKKQEKNG